MNKINTIKHLCIYTTKDVLNHKQIDGYCYWQFANRPKVIDTWENNEDLELRLYFAIEKNIVGYFVVDTFDDNNQLNFDGDTWKKIVPIVQKQFQGFKYITREK